MMCQPHCGMCHLSTTGGAPGGFHGTQSLENASILPPRHIRRSVVCLLHLPEERGEVPPETFRWFESSIRWALGIGPGGLGFDQERLESLHNGE
jgi:hypothetical protein